MALSAQIEHSDLLSAVEAGRQFGYTNDYVAKLARENKIVASRVGREWFVDPNSLGIFVEKSKESKRDRAERIRSERILERKRAEIANARLAQMEAPFAGPRVAEPPVVACIKAGAITLCGLAFGFLLFTSAPYVARENFRHDIQSANLYDVVRAFASRFYALGTLKTEKTEATSDARASAPQSSTTHEALLVIPEGVEDGMSASGSFSDEVTLTYDPDGRSGVITPVFKTDDSQEYRFMLVPLKVPDG